MESDLREWIIEYIRHKDVFHKKISEMSVDEGRVIIRYKDKNQCAFIDPGLEKVEENLAAIGRMKDFDSILFIVDNSRSNLDRLIKNWDRFSKIPQLTLYFVNPDSLGDKKWIISPYTHSKISEKGALKMGLESMFRNVSEMK